MLVHMVLSSWQSHGEPGSSARWTPIFGPSRSAWATYSPKLAAAVLHLPSLFITTQPQSSFYHPRLSQPKCLVAYRARLESTLLIRQYYAMPPTRKQTTVCRHNANRLHYSSHQLAYILRVESVSQSDQI